MRDEGLGPFAHTAEGLPPSAWEPLQTHLDKVAGLAAEFAGAFGAAEWGRLAGLWHDLGKIAPEFQARLRGSREQVEHAGVGAALAARHGPDGLPLAFVIAGHHAGLANLRVRADSDLTPLLQRIERNEQALVRLLPALPASHAQPTPRAPDFAAGARDRLSAGRRAEFWTRMLFSALVDADRLATEAFCDPRRGAARGAYPGLPDLQRRLDACLARFQPDTEVNAVRAAVLADCRDAAASPPGIFSLTAPTGSGKTLSAMAFALSHALRHGLRRVIVVVPYTSIIEQNAEAYRTAMGGDAVVEHHCNIDEVERERLCEETEVRRRLATENWDAPLIVTTTVQFFESLFSNHPGTCRKLHNIVRSVIILDEAQCLPAGFLACLLDALRELAGRFGCSVVVSTATQPALGQRDALPEGLDDVREVIADPPGLATRLDRVRVRWPADPLRPEPYAEIARRVTAHRRVLAVVHRRADARLLATLLPGEGRFHLSALMCPAHRLEVLHAIRARLEGDGVCRVVATQLVEAGVDLDFPVVYRALAGLDSIAQAAGRCNREGRLPYGEFIVFRAETAPPPGAPRIALEATEAVLAERGTGIGLVDPDTFHHFFRLFYHRSELDKKAVQPERAGLNFATVARLVQLIEDGHQRPVVVPWRDGAARLAAYERDPGRDTARALQPFIVQIPAPSAARLLEDTRLRSVSDALLALAPGWEALYSTEFGLLVEAPEDVRPTSLIV